LEEQQDWSFLTMIRDNIKFLLTLDSEYWDQPPVAECRINGNTVWGPQQITKGTVANFDVEFEHDKEYTFELVRSGKTDDQVKTENNVIVKDQLLSVKNLNIDGVDLGNIIYEIEYYPEYPTLWYNQQKEAGNEPASALKNITTFGWNGSWKLKVTSPFYLWLLENLY
jgi:hypothetical protein